MRQSWIQLQPTAIEQLNHLIAIDSRHTRCRGMSQRALDLASAPGRDSLSPSSQNTRLPQAVELWLPHRRIAHRDELKRPAASEGKAFQVGRNGPKC